MIILNKFLESDYARTIFYYLVGTGIISAAILAPFQVPTKLPLFLVGTGFLGIMLQVMKRRKEEKERMIIHHGRTV